MYVCMHDIILAAVSIWLWLGLTVEYFDTQIGYNEVISLLWRASFLGFVEVIQILPLRFFSLLLINLPIAICIPMHLCNCMPMAFLMKR